MHNGGAENITVIKLQLIRDKEKHVTSFEVSQLVAWMSNHPKKIVNDTGMYIKDRQRLSIKRGTEEKAADANMENIQVSK